MSRRRRRHHQLVVLLVGNVAGVVGPQLLPQDPAPTPDQPVGVVDTTASWPDVPPVETTQTFPPICCELPDQP